MPFKTAAELGLLAPSGTLTDLLRQVREAFEAVADATPVLVGARYLEQFGAGSDPRVVFVPELGGRIVAASAMGRAGAFEHSCSVYVRAAETGDDVTRFDNAYALAARVIDFVQTAGTGFVSWGAFADDSPAKVDAYGAGLAFSFTFRRDILHDAARWALPAATDATAGPIPQPPPGSYAADPLTVDVTVTPTT